MVLQCPGADRRRISVKLVVSKQATGDEARQACVTHVALAFLGRSGDAAVWRGHAEAVDRIAAPFSADRDFQLEQARVWGIATYAAKEEPAVCRGYAEAVDRIAAFFPADREFHLEQALAWRFVAFATTAEPAVCRGYAEAVDRIAAPFPADREFQLERGQAWRFVAFATKEGSGRAHLAKGSSR